MNLLLDVRRIPHVFAHISIAFCWEFDSAMDGHLTDKLEARIMHKLESAWGSALILLQLMHLSHSNGLAFHCFASFVLSFRQISVWNSSLVEFFVWLLTNSLVQLSMIFAFLLVSSEFVILSAATICGPQRESYLNQKQNQKMVLTFDEKQSVCDDIEQ